jgi:hypothetical protein
MGICGKNPAACQTLDQRFNPELAVVQQKRVRARGPRPAASTEGNTVSALDSQ